jgi:holo-[acyl-carrier protein] synthase
MGVKLADMIGGLQSSQKRRHAMPPAPDVLAAKSPVLSHVRTGIDIVQISSIDASLRSFGTRFTRRLFTAAEIDDANAQPRLAAKRYAERFAAKEAALKAFDLAHAGINWRDIEVVQDGRGGCHLCLHGKAAQLVEPLPADAVSLSLSHDGDYAMAIVVATCAPSNPHSSQPTS